MKHESNWNFNAEESRIRIEALHDSEWDLRNFLLEKPYRLVDNKIQVNLES